jgi:metal-responsive CopG/Arc/MetJ family transcriptional regulator
MSVVRMNITIPEELAHQLNRMIGSRKKSQFIAGALRESINKIKYKELQKALEEGYKARAQESRSFAKEYESIDLEGWDEY